MRVRLFFLLVLMAVCVPAFCEPESSGEAGGASEGQGLQRDDYLDEVRPLGFSGTVFDVEYVFYWDLGFKLNLDTANARLMEDPLVAYGIYATLGGTSVYNGRFEMKNYLNLGFSSYAGYHGFVGCGLSYGPVVYKSDDCFVAVLGSLDFQTYCWRVPFWAVGVDFNGHYFLGDNIGIYSDIGFYYDFSFISFMTKFELGVSLR